MEKDNVARTSLAGQLLLAMPGLSDPNFLLSVTLICEHNEEGAFGLIVNQPLPGATAEIVFKEAGVQAVEKALAMPLFVGGPVHPGHLFVLHGPPLAWEATLPVSDFVSMTSSQDILSAIARGKGPDSVMFLLGCAGWGPGQLDAELLENVWLTCPATETLLFQTPLADRWEEAAKTVGVDMKLLSDVSGHA